MTQEAGEPFSLARAMSTEEGVYGLILVSGVIAAMGGSGTPVLRVLIVTVITLAVFWAAHVYSGTVAAHGAVQSSGAPVGLGEALRNAARRARGMFAAVMFPAAALLLGVIGALENATAIWLSLWICVAALAWLGYLAYARKRARILTRIVGALATASFGIVIIVAKAIVSH